MFNSFMKIMNVLWHKGVAFINNFKIIKYNTVLWQKFLVFTVFHFNYESFSMNDGLVDRQYKSTSMLLQNFPTNSFFTLKLKVSFLESFVIYSSYSLLFKQTMKFQKPSLRME